MYTCYLYGMGMVTECHACSSVDEMEALTITTTSEGGGIRTVSITLMPWTYGDIACSLIFYYAH